jgi:hypothetical protein
MGFILINVKFNTKLFVKHLKIFIEINEQFADKLSINYYSYFEIK